MKPLVFILTLALAFAPRHARAENSATGEDDGFVLRLLAGYLNNDPQLQELAVRARMAETGRERAGLENGFDIELSSGMMRLYYRSAAANASGGWIFSAEPKATLKFPMFNNTSVSVSSPVTFEANETGRNASPEDVKISLSTDIVSSAGKQRKAVLLKAERALLEARRAISRRGLAAEREFYDTLRQLYESAIQALTFEEEAYTKEIEFAMAQRQGYSASSVYYRTLQLEAADAHRAASEQRRAIERNTASFARDCGIPIDALPEAVPKMDAENAPEFGREEDRSRFAEIESAIWNSYIGALSRSASGHLTLSAQGGVTAGNSYLGKETSADVGLTLGWKGVSLSVESQIPVSGPEKRPALSLSLAYNMNRQRLAPLDDAEKSLQAESEAIAFKTANRSWENAVDSMRTEREDLIWEVKRHHEQYELYRELSEETDEWFGRGAVTESERRKARANVERARLRILAADIRIRILFIDWSLKFTGD